MSEPSSLETEPYVVWVYHVFYEHPVVLKTSTGVTLKLLPNINILTTYVKHTYKRYRITLQYFFLTLQAACNFHTFNMYAILFYLLLHVIEYNFLAYILLSTIAKCMCIHCVCEGKSPYHSVHVYSDVKSVDTLSNM